MKFKIGDRVKYTFHDGEELYGTVIDVDENSDCYPYRVHYDISVEDSRICAEDITDNECDYSIELVCNEKIGFLSNLTNKYIKDVLKALATRLDEDDDVGYDRNVWETFNRLTYNYRYRDLNSAALESDVEMIINWYNNLVPIEKKPQAREMTLEEIEDILGYKVKIKEN